MSTERAEASSRRASPGADASVRWTPRPPGPTCLVGIGVSVEGVDALASLLSAVAPGTGMTFLVVALGGDPAVVGQLAAQLAAESRVPVVEAGDASPLAPDHVYLLPAHATARLDRGVLHLEALPKGRPHMPVDALLRAVALEREGGAIAVILAGSGSDGALGVQAIKDLGGIVFAQDPRWIAYPGMPAAAIGSGGVDQVATPAEIAVELSGIAARMRAVAYAQTPLPEAPLQAGTQASPGLPTPVAGLEGDPDVKRILTVLQAAHQTDFSLYRQSTVARRIQRRMVLAKVETARAYLDLLRERPTEVAALHRDLLVSVTQFFRDPEVFDALQHVVFPKLFEARRDRAPTGAPIRVWVPGCSTGEEVYSIAIALLEAAAEQHVEVPFQIFGTDVSDEALEVARAGAYLENIAADVTPDRLRRFFTRAGARYQVGRAVRESCLFARHDLTRDVPFSHIDLVSCRNVLIYLDPAVQRRVVPLLHFALEQGGCLVLGATEALREGGELFSFLDKSGKIYAKNPAPAQPAPFELLAAAPRSPTPPPDGPASMLEAQREADRLVMSRFAPPGVLVGPDLTIVQFRGHTGPYIDPVPGEASLDLLKMARAGLALELRNAVHKARRTGEPVRVDRIRLRDGEQERQIAVEVIPLVLGEGQLAISAPGLAYPPASGSPASAREGVVAFNGVAGGLGAGAPGRWLLVLFEEPSASRSDAPPRASRAERKNEIERELDATKAYLRATIEEHDALSEELQSANEELISSNEELQSINDDLAAAREDLLAANAELALLNQELTHRNAELRRRSDDLGNLLRSVDVPLLLLGGDLTLRHYTPPAERAMNLLPGDVGRPIRGAVTALGAPDLEHLAAEVLETGVAREREVQGRDGRAFTFRVRPSLAADGKVDGVVIVLAEGERGRRAAPAEGGAG